MPFGICALRAVDALGTRTAMALGCRCHRSAEGDDALLRCVLLRTRCVGFWFGSGFGSRREGDCPFAGCRAFFSSPRFGRCPFGVLVFAMAAPLAPSRRRRSFWFACACAGIRESLACPTRRPCAGRHLLFFAAAKKSRQKKAAHTASSFFCLRAPKGSYASHGNFPVRVRCQRSCDAPHPLHAPASHQAVPNSPRPPRWQTVCRLSRHTRTTPDR